MFGYFLVFLMISILIIYYKYFKNEKTKLLDEGFPSPSVSVPIFGHTLDIMEKGCSNILKTFSEYMDQYGETIMIKIGPRRQLYTCELKLIQFLLTSNVHIDKTIQYRYLRPWLGNGLLTAGGQQWKKNRRLINPAFHSDLLREFIDVIEENGEILVEKLTNEVYRDIDIYPFVTLYAFDVICESSMGTIVNAQKNGASKFLKAIKVMGEIIINRTLSITMFDFFFFFSSDYQREKQALETLHERSNSVIMFRKKVLENENDDISSDKKKRVAFLDLLLSHESLSLDEIRQEVDTFLFAGHDTTASAISFTLFNIANYPDIQKKIYKEQQEIFGTDLDAPITIRTLLRMEYLEMVIKETLRLYPSVPMFARMITEDTLYDGKFIPKGTEIIIAAYKLHLNPKYYQFPEKFDPSRFEHSESRLPFSYIPFSYGPRNCIGQKFAMINIKSIVSKIVRKFILEPTNPPYVLEISNQTVLISKNGIRMKLKSRDTI